MDNIEKIYDKIAMELEEYLQENSIYKPYFYKVDFETKEFPRVVFKELPREIRYTTLSYTEEQYIYGFEINVYSISNRMVSSATTANEISSHIEKFFKDKYRMNITVSRNVPNEDTDVYRNLIQANCIIDTKFKDRLVIYPS